MALLLATPGRAQVDIIKIADGDTPIPGVVGETFDDFSAPAIDGARVAFQGRSGDFHSPAQSGIFVATDGVIGVIADLFTPIPNGQGCYFRRFDAPSIDGSKVCFWGQYPGPATETCGSEAARCKREFIAKRGQR